MTPWLGDCRAAEPGFDDARVPAAERALPGAGTAGRGRRGPQPPSGTRGACRSRRLGAEAQGRWSGTRERNEQSPQPGARSRASCAHPAPPPPLPARTGVPGPGSGAPPGSPPFARGGGKLAPPGTRRFKPAPSSLLLSDGGPPLCSPQSARDRPPAPL